MARGPLMPSPLLLLSPRLMLMPTTDTTDTLLPTTDTDMPAMDTMDTHMPTTMDITMARGPLMLSPLLMPTTDMPTTERDLLMLKPMLMLTTDTHMLTVTDMPTADTTDTHTLTDGESKMLTK